MNFTSVSCAGALLRKGLNLFSMNGLQQIRTTYILKRRWAPFLSKLNFRKRRLRSSDFVYDLVEHSIEKKKPKISVILKDDVEGIGNKGDVVDVRDGIVNYILIPGQLAEYASPENLAKLQELKEKGLIQTHEKHSSPWAPMTAKNLSYLFLNLVMNMEEKWTLEPWHFRVAFRKAAVAVPEDAITMPLHPISGPNIDLEGKQFLIRVTINQREIVPVRCTIHHWTTNIKNRLPYVYEFWKSEADPLFPEEAEELKQIAEKQLMRLKK